MTRVTYQVVEHDELGRGVDDDGVRHAARPVAEVDLERAVPEHHHVEVTVAVHVAGSRPSDGGGGQASMTMGMIIGRRLILRPTQPPTWRRITCCSW